MMSEDDDTKDRILDALQSGKPTKETLSQNPELAQSLYQSIIAIQPAEESSQALSADGARAARKKKRQPKLHKKETQQAVEKLETSIMGNLKEREGQ